MNLIELIEDIELGLQTAVLVKKKKKGGGGGREREFDDKDSNILIMWVMRALARPLSSQI